VIEIVGGPHDGKTLKRRPKPGQTIFLAPNGFYRTTPSPGDEALMEIGRCFGCGARLGKTRRGPRQFSPVTMATAECPLCGVVNP
jgi:hypothetical protein